MAKLSAREKLFVSEFLLDFDEGRAALAAGFAAPADGRRLLRKRAVQAEIQQAKERQAERYAISPERILLEWSRIAFANARNFHPALGETVDLSQLSVDQTAAVSEFAIDEQIDERTGQIYRRTRVKLHDKLAALRDIARSIGMLREERYLTIEMKIQQMSPQERERLADELLERGRQYLPEYEAAVARGEVGCPRRIVTTDRRPRHRAAR